VAVGSGTAELGTPVETGGRVFVPDFTTGRVWIVDLAQAKVVAQPQVISTPAHFQLLVRDGIVFFNDPASEHAGVLRLDGGVRPIAKYDPRNPGKGLTGGSGGDRPHPPTGDPTGPTPTGPTAPPSSTDPPPGQPSGGGPPPGGSGRLPGAVHVQIVLSRPRALVGEDITLKAVVTGGSARARWDFGDGQTAEGLSTTHHWATARTFQVSVTATFANGQQAASSVAVEVTVTPPVTATLTVQAAGGGGTVTSQPAGISCPPTCSAPFATTDTVTLTATAPPPAQFTGWAGACSGTATTCQLTVPATGAQVTATFVQGFRLTVSVPTGGGTVSGSGGIACPSTCRAGFSAGQSVTLTATPAQYFAFNGWGGACAGTATTCSFTMDADKTASASFRDLAEPEDCVSHDPNRLQIVQSGQSFQLVDSGTHLMATFNTNQEAQNGLSVARGYTQHCFVGRGTQYIMQYWKGGAGRAGPVSPEDCVSYDPGNLTIVQVNDSSGTWWSLRDGGHYLEAFTSQSRAIRGLRVAQQYTSHCFITRPNAVFEYWR
jgi:hypothetical protein